MSRDRPLFRYSNEDIVAYLRERKLDRGFLVEDLAKMHPKRYENDPAMRAIWWARERIKTLRKQGVICSIPYHGADRRRAFFKVVQ
jgi:hypothetical protein